MRVPDLLSLCLAGFTAAAPSTLVKRNSFNGVGQIRAQWNEGNNDDLGCLTNTGKWTVDEKLCGTFTATPLSGNLNIQLDFTYSYSLKTDNGPCYIYGASLVCDNGNAGYPAMFGVWPWTKEFPYGIPNVPTLRMGVYGFMATFGNNPPLAEEEPQSVHFVTYREKGKYVWLTWRGL